MKNLAKTKQKILHVLKKEGQQTMDEMMVYFTISEIAVRKHLRELERDAYVEKEEEKQEIGRPYYVYELTKAGHALFPNQYEELPLQLLHDLETLEGEDAVSKLLDQRTKRETSDMKEHATATDFLEKVKEVAEVQNEKGCMVEIEETENGDVVMTHFNCPIANIANKYQRVCQNEKKMYRNIFPETKVICETKMTDGYHCCRWIIKNPKDTSKTADKK